MPHRTLIRLALSALAATLILGSTTAQRPPARVDEGLPVAKTRLHTTTSGQVLCAAWEDTRNGQADIYFNRSLDDGVSWLSTDVRLDTDVAGAAGSHFPRVSVAGTAVYVIWVDERSSVPEVHFNRSLDLGATWLSSDIRISDGNGAVTALAKSSGWAGPRLAAVGSHVHVCWTESPLFGAGLVLFKASADQGSSWPAVAQQVNPGLPIDWLDTADLAAAGIRVYVAFRHSGGTIHVNRSEDNGNTWLAVPIAASAGSYPTAAAPRLAVAGSSVYLTWFELFPPGPGVFFNRSLDFGVGWAAADTRLDTAGAFGVQGPDLAAAGAAVFVTWSDDRNGFGGNHDVFVNRSLNGGGTWLGTELRLDTDAPGAAHSTRPRVVAHDAHVAVAWSDNRQGGEELTFNRSTDGGSTWLANDRLPGISLGPGELPALAISAEKVAMLGAGQDVEFSVPWGLLQYGTGVAGSGGFVPNLTGGGFPTLGSTFTMDIDSAFGGAVAGLAIGGAKTSTPVFGGTLLVTPLTVTAILLGGSPGVAGAGAWTAPLTLPVDEAFVGGAIFFQLLVIDPGAPGSVSISNGLELWIG